ncbi:M14 family zinc carboxypeptidase [Dethiothermospora halolimnae]|uniref:M14 family zinc carboxypeptidase n=1 Tax=Dethiothermospora halolimnae TaxID=3114390 RepID=UPI003CCC3DDA
MLKNGLKGTILLIILLFISSTVSATDFDPTKPITSSMMKNILIELEKSNPDIIKLDIIGKSHDNKEIYSVRLGNGNVEILIGGSIHARERITTNIILQNIKDYIKAYRNNTKIDGYNVKALLNQVTITFVPMINPDGVDYTIEGKNSIKDSMLREAIGYIEPHPNNISYTDSRWKANIVGVDLNRNWNVSWDMVQKYEIDRPSDAHFKGYFPMSQPEVIALKNLSISKPYIGYYSYHTQGHVLYWYTNQKGQDLEELKDVTRAIQRYTRFRLDPNINNIKRDEKPKKGYISWTSVKLHKPSLVVEFANGRYSEKDFWKIYKRSKAIPLITSNKALKYKDLYKYNVFVTNKLVQKYKSLERAKTFCNDFIEKDKKAIIKYEGKVVYSK